MAISKINPPKLRDKLTPHNISTDTLDLLMQRRSLTVKDFIAPGPSDEQVEQLLTIGSRVPDHKQQVPWRFIIIKEDARAKIGEVIKAEFIKCDPDATAAIIEFEKNRFMRAPVTIAVVSTADPENKDVPEWEQILTSGAVCQNIIIAANAMGFCSQWLSEWYAYNETVLEALGLESGERIAGFIYIGSTKKTPAERGRPDVSKLVTIL